MESEEGKVRKLQYENLKGTGHLRETGIFYLLYL
jgi:hypothetical protein